ncbi:hypothetical protein ABTP23_16230 [Acinetobacter baumannii]|uniref:hypothetical protein n=1 Tax=Acinetobacter baumannii TaxID=470 RepID=UPI003AF9F622
MKKALFALAVLFLAGCEPSTKEKTGDFILPPDLKDCRIYNLSDGSNMGYVRSEWKCSKCNHITYGKYLDRIK